MKRNPLMLSACASLLLLGAGCSTVKDQLGLNRRAPDEFAVMSRAPLDIPPDIDNISVPAPRPGAPRPQEPDPAHMARASIFGATDTRAASAGISGGDADFLRQVGADKAPANIRHEIEKESEADSLANRTAMDRIMGRKGKAQGDVLDPIEERKRLDKKGVAPGPEMPADAKTRTVTPAPDLTRPPIATPLSQIPSSTPPQVNE